MNLDPRTADTVLCDRCGANFRVQALAAVVPCPYCGHQQQLSQERLGRLATYQQQVGAHDAAADEHAQQLAAWQQWYGDREDGQRKLGTGTFFLFFAGFAVLSGGIGALLAALGIVQWELVPTFVMMGGFMPAMVAFYGLYFYRLSKSQTAQADRAGAVRVACPSCGAPGGLTPGEVVDHCKHCRAPLVPTREIMAQAVDAAVMARRQAAIERYRTERDAMSQVYSRSASGAAAYFAVLPFALMFSIAAIGLTHEVVTGETQTRPEAIALVWLITLAVWGVFFGILMFRKNRKARTRAALDHLARQFSGQILENVSMTAAWLNQFWAGPYPIQQFYVGSGYGAVALRVGPYLAMLDYNPERAQHMVQRTQLMIAAWVPGAFDGGQAVVTAAAQPLVSELRREGWEVSFQEGGIIVKADEQLVRQMKRPEALHVVAPVLDRAVRVAEAMGCRPVVGL